MSSQPDIPADTTPRLDPTAWLDAHGDLLFGYAMQRLGRREDAEDVVQEALLAAVRAAETFDARSSESTWLVGILRHKVYDLMRRRSREAAWMQAVSDELGTSPPDFSEDGWWTGVQSEGWQVPDLPAEREEFLAVLEASIDRLPPVMRQAFFLSEVDQVPNAEICEILGVSRTNLWTLLHRARLRLRRELDDRWFNPRDAQ